MEVLGQNFLVRKFLSWEVKREICLNRPTNNVFI